eukprot:COSAG04_NODE_1566_length_6320_cov_15.884102_9_plen_169_part_00
MLPAPGNSRERSACAVARPGAGRAASPRGRQTAATARAPAPPCRRCFIWPCKALRKRTLGAGLSGGGRRADQGWADPVRHAGELQLLAPLARGAWPDLCCIILICSQPAGVRSGGRTRICGPGTGTGRRRAAGERQRRPDQWDQARLPLRKLLKVSIPQVSWRSAHTI